MKLVPKLALALFAGVVLVVAVFTAWRVHSEIQAFDQDARRDQRIVGVTASAALAKTRTREDAIRLARRVDASRENITIRFVSLEPTALATLAPRMPLAPSEIPKPGALKQLVRARTPDVDSVDELITYVAAPVVDEPLGAIELTQPLTSRKEYIWRGVVSGLVSSLAMLFVGGGTIVLIGARIVGQPVSELIVAARNIGAGKFDAAAPIERPDEFGEIARALSSMGRELSAERRRSKAEAEAKIDALEQLRHAERLTTLGKLASVLAHEIGTPLNVIAGHSKLVARFGNEATQESANAISSQSERITGIVRRVLDYARRRPARHVEVDAATVMLRSCALLRSLAEQTGVTLEFEPPAHALPIHADPDQLQQAITNVIVNAIYVTPRGGAISLAVRDQGQQFVVFDVGDSGPGVDAAVRDRIFEPFFTTKPPGEGTGLGLSVARDIVREHGGRIEVSARAQGGALFQLYLARSLGDASTSNDR